MADATVVPALCINLEGATERWAHVQQQAAAWLTPIGVPLTRIAAVHWRSLLVPSSEPVSAGAFRMVEGVRMTPFTQWLVQGGAARQRLHRASHWQMDTPSSVACMLSHVRCWQWLHDRPHVPAALILEDDVCLDGAAFLAAPGLPPHGRQPDPVARPRRRPPPASADRAPHPVPERQLPSKKNMLGWEPWPSSASPRVDVLVLGYFREEAPRPVVITAPGEAPLRLRAVDGFFGMHCYYITQEGAARLLRDAFPLELQSDGYICALSQLGRVQMFLLPGSVATQCKDGQGSLRARGLSNPSGFVGPDQGPSPLSEGTPRTACSARGHGTRTWYGTFTTTTTTSWTRSMRRHRCPRWYCGSGPSW